MNYANKFVRVIKQRQHLFFVISEALSATLTTATNGIAFMAKK
jgi:hypothetical protein